uniref:Purple acid phosphatase n=1 Tax=Daucus carota subsp. sativus TaxID=79200 RepID=A0A166HZH3_DAUCS
MEQRVSFKLFIIFLSNIFVLLCLFSTSSSQSPPRVDNLTKSEFANHTAISDFRTINRRSLEECPDPNPYLQIAVSSRNSKLADDEFVTVTITGVLLPSESDWVAMVSPAHSNVTSCPSNAIEYLQTGDYSTLPLLCHYPVKAQYVSSDPGYLGCKKKECKKRDKGGACVVTTCSASLKFHVINIRTDIEFVFFSGGFLTPCILKRSTPRPFANPKIPLYGHLSSIDSTGNSMRVTWVSGDNSPQQVQYGNGKSQISTVTTFSQDDMCKSPAKDFGWHDPGYIHSAVMTGLEPSTTLSYRYGSNSAGWSNYTKFKTPPAGGSDEVRFLAFGDMGKAPRDPSLEHYIQYTWMKKDMASVNRTRTPWLIFMGHRPMYSTPGDGLILIPSVDADFVQAVEPLLLSNKVDLALFGHVHNYERTCAVYQGECKAMPKKDGNGVDTYDNSNYKAPVHAIIGMAGFKLDSFSSTFMAGMVLEDGSPSVSSPLQFFSLMSLSPGIGSPYPWLREMKSEERGLYLIHLLVTTANHVAAGSIENANMGLEQISHLSSPDGDTMQRIAAHFTEALADRMLKRWPGLHKALNSTKITSVSEERLVQKLFFELCPFLKLSYVITNQAIIEAMEGEKVVHIIDLNSVEPAQWINLLQLFSARPEGPPHLRITGIHEQKEVLDEMAHRLNEEAGNLDIPFQFNSIVTKLENLDIESLRVKTGEAVAVSSVLQLHHLLAFDDEMLRRNSPLVNKGFSSIHMQAALQNNTHTLGDFLEKDMMSGYTPSPDSTSSSPLSLASAPKMVMFLNALWSLSPKLMVVTEQESNHNGCSLMDRIYEALNFYASLFDCLPSTASRVPVDRQKLEKMLFGEEIKNIISCEGLERKERHEKLEKWIPRLEMAGFGRVGLSYHTMMQARTLLQSYGYEGFKIKEEHGCLVMCWQNQPLYSVSAWRFRRYS